jgi:hypothetical protein
LHIVWDGDENHGKVHLVEDLTVDLWEQALNLQAGVVSLARKPKTTGKHWSAYELRVRIQGFSMPFATSITKHGHVGGHGVHVYHRQLAHAPRFLSEVRGIMSAALRVALDLYRRQGKRRVVGRQPQVPASPPSRRSLEFLTERWPPARAAPTFRQPEQHAVPPAQAADGFRNESAGARQGTIPDRAELRCLLCNGSCRSPVWLYVPTFLESALGRHLRCFRGTAYVAICAPCDNQFKWPRCPLFLPQCHLL